MDDTRFRRTKDALDAELDSLPQSASVGIKMGWTLYTEFRSRNLLAPKLADMVVTKWMLPSYRGMFVSDMFDTIHDDEYEVGKP